MIARSAGRFNPAGLFLAAKDLAGRGTSVVIAGNIFVNLIRIVSTVVLTRLLTSEDFGVVGIISAMMFIFAMLTDVGFYSYVVRHAEADQPGFLDEIWTLRLIRGMFLTSAVMLLSGPIASYLEKPELQTVIAVSGLFLTVECFSSMAFATAAREAMLRRLTLLDVVPHTLSIGFSILLAVLLRNYWAIIGSMFFGAFVKIVLSYWMFPGSGRRWRFSRSRAKDLWAFGRYITGSSTLQIFIMQADKIVLARVFSLREFGLYTLASNLAQVPGNLTGNYSNRVLYPIFARAHREAPEQFGSVYYSAGRPLRYLYMFAVGGFIACAPFIIKLLYDDRYARAGLYLQLLAIATVFKMPVAVASDALVASGGVKHFLRMNLAKVPWLLASGFVLYLYFGPIGIVLALVSSEVVGQLYCWWALHRQGVFRIGRELAFFAPVLPGYGIGLAVNAIGLHLLP